MSCGRNSKKLAQAALGALGPRRQAELQAHLHVCTECREELNRQRQLLAAIDQSIAASIVAEPSAGLAAEVWRRVEREPVPGRSSFSPWLPLVAGALALLLVSAWLARRQAAPTNTLEAWRSPPIEQNVDDNTPSPAETIRSRSVRAQLDTRPATRRSRVSSATRTEQMAGAAPPFGHPEVLVMPGQPAAVLQLYRAVWSRRLDGSSLLAQTGPLEPDELTIAPLQVARLDLEQPLLPPGNRP